MLHRPAATAAKVGYRTSLEQAHSIWFYPATTRCPDVIGVAALAAVWPGPGLRRGLFLKELFVTASRRGQGIGAALMRAAARLAVEGGWGRIDWTANRDDAPLLAFYRDLGAAEQREKLFFRLGKDVLHALAAELP